MHRLSTSINVEGGLILSVETSKLGVSTKCVKHLIVNKKTNKGETALRVRRPPRKPKGSEACKETPQAAPMHAEQDKGRRRRAKRGAGGAKNRWNFTVVPLINRLTSFKNFAARIFAPPARNFIPPPAPRRLAQHLTTQKNPAPKAPDSKISDLSMSNDWNG